MSAYRRMEKTDLTWRQNTVEELLGLLSAEELKAMPESLYWQGDKQLLTTGPRIAIVGSRKASPDGIRKTKEWRSSLSIEAQLLSVGWLWASIPLLIRQQSMPGVRP